MNIASMFRIAGLIAVMLLVIVCAVWRLWNELLGMDLRTPHFVVLVYQVSVFCGFILFLVWIWRSL